jgi:hypothetical protein
VDSPDYIEHSAALVASLDRDELKALIREFHGSFKPDFTDDYLDTVTLDRLRHIVFAMLLIDNSQA